MSKLVKRYDVGHHNFAAHFVEKTNVGLKDIIVKKIVQEKNLVL